MNSDKPKHEPFSVNKRIGSFRHAINGIRLAISSEHNMRIHFFAAVIAIGAGFLLRISSHDWMAIIFAIGFVFAAELFNSAIESISDFISPGHHADIGKIKDISAGAVLVAVITSVIIGILVYWPHLKSVIKF